MVLSGLIILIFLCAALVGSPPQIWACTSPADNPQSEPALNPRDETNLVASWEGIGQAYRTESGTSGFAWPSGAPPLSTQSTPRLGYPVFPGSFGPGGTISSTPNWDRQGLPASAGTTGGLSSPNGQARGLPVTPAPVISGPTVTATSAPLSCSPIPSSFEPNPGATPVFTHLQSPVPETTGFPMLSPSPDGVTSAYVPPSGISSGQRGFPFFASPWGEQPQGPVPNPGGVHINSADSRLGNPDIYTSPGPVAEIRRMEDLEILAKVGSSWILAGDIRPGVAEVLEERASAIPPHERPIVEKMATVRILDQMIETRLLYLAATQRIPAERLAEIEKRLAQVFEDEELPRRVKAGNFDSVQAYQTKLESLGGSLERERRLFIERAIASQWLHHAIGPIPEPDPGELLQYYQEHIDEFETPAQVRWEEVWVNIPRYSDGLEAWAKLAHVGNMLLQGVPLEQALASQPPGEPRCYGQRRDWLPAGSPLVSPVMQAVLFQLPVGFWSEIFREQNRFYIVRVLERKEAVRTPFSEAQPKIRKQLVEHRRKEKIRAYLAELRSQTTIWTVFDEDPQATAWRKAWAQGK